MSKKTSKPREPRTCPLCGDSHFALKQRVKELVEAADRAVAYCRENRGDIYFGQGGLFVGLPQQLESALAKVKESL